MKTINCFDCHAEFLTDKPEERFQRCPACQVRRDAEDAWTKAFYAASAAGKMDEIDLDLADEKGRAIGIYIHRFEFEGLFYVEAGVMRDRDAFGATQGSNKFDTAAERETYIAKRIKTTRANAVRRLKKIVARDGKR